MASPPFDVFLSHNSSDKPTVRRLADALQARGVRPWLDERELVPGRPWQEALEEVLDSCRSVAVLVGSGELGPWHLREMRAGLEGFVQRDASVIPVLLPGAPKKVELPLFLRAYTWVDLRSGITDDGVGRLIAGIRGSKPPAPPRPPRRFRVSRASGGLLVAGVLGLAISFCWRSTDPSDVPSRTKTPPGDSTTARAEVRGRVLDEAGRPIRDARVVAVGSGGGVATTDADGQFALTARTGARELELQVYKDGYESVTEYPFAGDFQVEVRLREKR